MTTRHRRSTAARGYGAFHAKLRRKWQPIVTAGRARCVRCGDPIAADAAWHLDHADDRQSHLGPAHARCNIEARDRARGMRHSRVW
jgi:hypothetical protein